MKQGSKATAKIKRTESFRQKVLDLYEGIVIIILSEVIIKAPAGFILVLSSTRGYYRAVSFILGPNEGWRLRIFLFNRYRICQCHLYLKESEADLIMAMLARSAARPALNAGLSVNAARASIVPARSGFHSSATQQSTLRELEHRIKSVKNIEKITKVSPSHLIPH